MKALLLAAGQGKRMQPLSLITPKPLLCIGKYRLIEHHLINLAKAGFTEVLINLHYRSQDFAKILGNGENYNLNITYIYEPNPGLEAGGTIINAKQFLDNNPFLMISSDIFTSYNFKNLKTLNPEIAHLLLIDNNQSNDFNFINGRITSKGSLSYANIGVFNPTAFDNWPENCKITLSTLINYQLKNNQTINAEIIGKNTMWHNVSTPQQLASLNAKYQTATG
jgi:MurNAc alpha-1-phosphate uridylyltransferase